MTRAAMAAAFVILAAAGEVDAARTKGDHPYVEFKVARRWTATAPLVILRLEIIGSSAPCPDEIRWTFNDGFFGGERASRTEDVEDCDNGRKWSEPRLYKPGRYRASAALRFAEEWVEAPPIEIVVEAEGAGK